MAYGTGSCPYVCLMILSVTIKTSGRMAGIPTEIRIQHRLKVLLLRESASAMQSPRQIKWQD